MPLALLVALTVTTAAPAAERGFELVSPPDGLNYAAQGQAAQPDGNGLYWVTAGGVQTLDPAPPDGARTDWFLARRSATEGWSSSWVTPDPEGTPATVMEIQGAIPGMQGDGVTFATTAGSNTIFDPLGIFAGTAVGTTLLSAAAGQAAQMGLDPTQWLASEDLNTTVFATSAALDVNDSNGTVDLYRRHGADVELVSRRTDGSPDTSGGAPYLPFAQGDNAGAAAYYTFGVSGFPSAQGASPLASDGRAIAFATATSLDPADTDSADDLYLWRDGRGIQLVSDDDRAESGCPTVPDSTTDCPASVGFAGMSADASVIYLRTTERLLDSDTDDAADLYAYAPNAPAGSRLTLASGPGASPAYQVAIAADGTLFFVSVDRLDAHPPSAGPEPVLYRWKDGAVTAIAVLRTRDVFTANGPIDYVEGLAGGITGRPVRATADGDTVVFRTRAALDPAKDTDTAPDLYRWHAGEGLQLVSGGDPAPLTIGVNGSGPIGPMAGRPSDGAGRAISADGTRVFFTTAAALTDDGGDNGRVKLYEWREGRGIKLISPPGASAGAVTYLDNSSSGDDVFFLTGDALVVADTDGSGLDVYDARVGGGFPEPPPPPDPCAGDACQGLPRPSASLPVAASVSFVGAGNVGPAGSGPLGNARAKGPKAIKGAKGAVRVTVPAAGTISVSGNGVRRLTRRATKARTLSVPVRLSARATRTLSRSRRFSTRITVRYVPADGTAQTMRVTVRFQKARKKKSSSRASARRTKAEGR